MKTSLSDLAHRGHELPEELQELVVIISAILHSQISKDDAALLREDVDRMKVGFHYAEVCASYS